MGYAQLDAASLFRHGQRGRLFMQQLPQRGELITGSLSGVTDSAASATAMSAGVKTYNHHVGVDRYSRPVEVMVEQAHRLGLAAGVVTTSALSHGTPGAFSAHVPDRRSQERVADDQVRRTRPEVMLGGGAGSYLPAGPNSRRGDAGLTRVLEREGWRYVTSRGRLLSARPGSDPKLFGLFAPYHMDFVVDRPAGTHLPTLAEMAETALRFLDARGTGFFLMIEGGRIDSASHLNDIKRVVAEVLDFDDAIQAVSKWGESRPNFTLLVTADHECGGLEVIDSRGPQLLPDVRWRWRDHTNARVPIYGRGPGAEIFAEKVLQNTWVHSAMSARLSGTPLTPPRLMLVPDGDLSDLGPPVVTNRAAAGAGPTQLRALHVAADDHGLGVGVEGVFEWDTKAIMLLIDVDLSAGTGPAGLRGALRDRKGRLDRLITRTGAAAASVAGFGIDFVAASWGGANPVHLQDYDGVGLRGLRDPFGHTGGLGHYYLPSAYADGTRIRAPSEPQPERGWEVHMPWTTLYPKGRPDGAVIGLYAILVDNNGGPPLQALPPLSPTTQQPGVVRFEVGTGARPQVLR